MSASFRLGRIAGVEVDVSWTVIVILALVSWSLAGYTLPTAAPGLPWTAYWTVGLLASVALVASILAHELSHAVVATRHGVPVERITLWLFGGVARLSGQTRDANTELLIALAGPAMSVAIGLAGLAAAGVAELAGAPHVIATALAWLGLLNLVLAVFNLLPGAPLDGGRVLAALLWRRTGDQALAQRSAAHAGRILGQVLIGLGLVEVVLGVGIEGLWLALIGWFLTSAAHAEETQTEALAAFEGVRVGDVMTSPVHCVDGGRTVAELVTGDALTAHVSSFPVVDAAGRPQGLVTLRRLRQLPPSSWATTPVAAVAVPLDHVAVARPDEPLVDVLGRAGACDGRVLVVDHGTLVGIVTPTDVTASLERLRLARAIGRQPGPRAG